MWRIPSRVGLSLPTLVATAAMFAGCATSGQFRHDHARLIFTCTVDAVVEVDDRPIASACGHPTGISVAPGRHRVRASATDYLTWRQDIETQPGAVYDVHIELWPSVDELDGD